MTLENFLDISAIELVAGLGYLFGNFLLSQKKTVGWIVKIIGGSAWTIFLFLNQNYIFMAVMITVLFMMVYGFYKWRVGQYDVHTKIDIGFEALAVLVAALMTLRFLILQDYTLSGFVEIAIVSAEIIGTILLAQKRHIGWYFYTVMSILVGVLVIFLNEKSAPLLGFLEWCSIYFYYKGIKNMKVIIYD